MLGVFWSTFWNSWWWKLIILAPVFGLCFGFACLVLLLCFACFLIFVVLLLCGLVTCSSCFFGFTVFCCVLWVLPFFVYCGLSVDLVFWVWCGFVLRWCLLCVLALMCLCFL